MEMLLKVTSVSFVWLVAEALEEIWSLGYGSESYTTNHKHSLYLEIK